LGFCICVEGRGVSVTMGARGAPFCWGRLIGRWQMWAGARARVMGRFPTKWVERARSVSASREDSTVCNVSQVPRSPFRYSCVDVGAEPNLKPLRTRHITPDHPRSPQITWYSLASAVSSISCSTSSTLHCGLNYWVGCGFPAR
jgi:hypothetical protein